MNQSMTVPADIETSARRLAAGAVLPLKTLAASEPAGADVFSFGSFSLLPTQRLLLQGDRPVRLGSRALDILIVLVKRRDSVVSKKELMAQVWPNTFVEEANITVHITALRRAIGDGQAGTRYIVNIPGRGYRFVAAVGCRDSARSEGLPISTTPGPQHPSTDLTGLIRGAGVAALRGEPSQILWILALVDVDGVVKPVVTPATIDELTGCLQARCSGQFMQLASLRFIDASQPSYSLSLEALTPKDAEDMCNQRRPTG